MVRTPSDIQYNELNTAIHTFREQMIVKPSSLKALNKFELVHKFSHLMSFKELTQQRFVTFLFMLSLLKHVLSSG